MTPTDDLYRIVCAERDRNPSDFLGMVAARLGDRHRPGRKLPPLRPQPRLVPMPAHAPRGGTVSLTHVGMFSGIGGFELAMAEAGIPTLAAAEMAQEVLR